MPKKTSVSDKALQELREFGLKYPGAHTKSPWPGHLDLAVNDKTFAYLSVEGDPFSISCKLPETSDQALMLPNTSPTAYGLGKSGWVTATFETGELPPVDILKAWLDESYRAQAPKKLVKQLGEQGGRASAAPPSKKPRDPAAPTTKRKATKRKKAAKKAAKRKAAKRKPISAR
jgi:predicted DNA-binding protein (MmcQ/YjbR family)